jgi:glutathione S-transferase
MATLYHHPLCPHSRFVRIVLAEFGMEPQLIEERAFERRRDFLALNPAGTTPLLVEEQAPAVPGAATIAEYLDETRGLALGDRRLMPEDPLGRVEVRRLMEWFHGKFFTEVSDWLVTEKIYKRYVPGAGAPNMELVRAARQNIRYHLRYIGWLVGQRNWLAGDRLTYADLAAAAHLSCVDFLGDVPWGEDEAAKLWYARVKSRPSFRAILADRMPGLTPDAVYADLDF